jgi:hypothetical protein
MRRKGSQRNMMANVVLNHVVTRSKLQGRPANQVCMYAPHLHRPITDHGASSSIPNLLNNPNRKGVRFFPENFRKGQRFISHESLV